MFYLMIIEDSVKTDLVELILSIGIRNFWIIIFVHVKKALSKEWFVLDNGRNDISNIMHNYCVINGLLFDEKILNWKGVIFGH